MIRWEWEQVCQLCRKDSTPTRLFHLTSFTLRLVLDIHPNYSDCGLETPFVLGGISLLKTSPGSAGSVGSHESGDICGKDSYPLPLSPSISEQIVGLLKTELITLNEVSQVLRCRLDCGWDKEYCCERLPLFQALGLQISSPPKNSHA